MSDDGSIVVGTNRFSENGPYSLSTGFVWTQADGMRDIVDVMADHGQALPADSMVVSAFVSPDGRAIGGTYLNTAVTPNLEYWSFVFRFAPPPPACIGDLDGNGATDVLDFGVFVGAFGSSIGDPGYIPEADFDQSGSIDVLDFGVFVTDFGCSDS